MSIDVTSADGYAIMGRSVNLLGGTFIANRTVASTHQLLVDGINISVDAGSSPAFESKHLTVKNLDTDYNGESSVDAKSTRKFSGSSIIFGKSAPAWVDYVLLAVVAIGLVCAIVVPVIRRKKKRELLYARLEQEGYTVVK